MALGWRSPSNDSGAAPASMSGAYRRSCSCRPASTAPGRRTPPGSVGTSAKDRTTGRSLLPPRIARSSGSMAFTAGCSLPPARPCSRLAPCSSILTRSMSGAGASRPSVSSSRPAAIPSGQAFRAMNSASCRTTLSSSRYAEARHLGRRRLHRGGVRRHLRGPRCKGRTGLSPTLAVARLRRGSARAAGGGAQARGHRAASRVQPAQARSEWRSAPADPRGWPLHGCGPGVLRHGKEGCD